MENNILEKISRSAKSTFPEIPFPNRKDEYWRFSDYNAWNTDSLFPFFTSHIAHEKNEKFDALQNNFCKMSDSLVVSDAIELHADFDTSKIEVTSLAAAAFKYPEKLEKLYGDARTKFDLLPPSRAGMGLYIKVADGADARLNFFECAKLPLSICAVIFDIGEGANLNLLRNDALYGGTFWANTTAFFLGKNSKLETASLSFGDKNSRKYKREDFYLNEGAKVLDALAEFGLGHTRQERNFILQENCGYLDSRVFSAVRGDITRDIRTRQTHLSKKCHSNLALKTALYDTSKLAFSGLIRVEEEASQTDAYLSSRSLLMSDAAKAQASPILEICSNDVSCSHGCTVSKPDEEQLFYMRSRGLSLSESKRLIVEGFAESSFEHLNDEFLRDSLKLHSDLF